MGSLRWGYEVVGEVICGDLFEEQIPIDSCDMAGLSALEVTGIQSADTNSAFRTVACFAGVSRGSRCDYPHSAP